MNQKEPDWIFMVYCAYSFLFALFIAWVDPDIKNSIALCLAMIFGFFSFLIIALRT